MKTLFWKLYFIILLLTSLTPFCLAQEIELNELNLDAIAINDVSAADSKNESFHLFDSISETAQRVYNLQVEDTNTVNHLFKNELTHTYGSGPIERIHTWGVLQLNDTTTIEQSGYANNKFNMGLIHLIMDGTFKGGKETFRIMLEPSFRHNVDNATLLQGLLQDFYVETKRIPNNKILIGNSRPAVGMEGSQSAYTLPFIARSQIARNFGTIRKFGLRLRGDYSFVDYDLGGYSSDRYWREFFPGVEFDGWVNFKPLAKTNGKYGNLKIGGGIVAGEHHCDDFFVAGCGIAYDYKKFWTKMEYASANGSNGLGGFTETHRQGWNITTGYHVTPKCEIIARYDNFDPDKTVKHNDQREYTLGVNYYVKGQALKLILNYVYCQNQVARDSHRIVVGSQIIL